MCPRLAGLPERPNNLHYTARSAISIRWFRPPHQSIANCPYWASFIRFSAINRHQGPADLSVLDFIAQRKPQPLRMTITAPLFQMRSPRRPRRFPKFDDWKSLKTQRSTTTAPRERTRIRVWKRKVPMVALCLALHSVKNHVSKRYGNKFVHYYWMILTARIYCPSTLYLIS